MAGQKEPSCRKFDRFPHTKLGVGDTKMPFVVGVKDVPV
jgi:hypothetical protein